MRSSNSLISIIKEENQLWQNLREYIKETEERLYTINKTLSNLSKQIESNREQHEKILEILKLNLDILKSLTEQKDIEKILKKTEKDS